MHKKITFILLLNIAIPAEISTMNMPTQSICDVCEENGEKLRMAIAHRDIERVKELLAAGADVNFTGGGKYGKYLPPLKIAVDWDRLDIALILLQAGANVNEDSDRGHTALQSAIKGNQYEIVKLLLSHGADPFKINSEGSAFDTHGISPLIVETVIEKMFEFPNHEQSKRIISFLCCMRRKFGHDVPTLCKNRILAIIKEENKQLLKDKIRVRQDRIPMDSEFAYRIIIQKCNAFEEINRSINSEFLQEAYKKYGE